MHTAAPTYRNRHLYGVVGRSIRLGYVFHTDEVRKDKVHPMPVKMTPAWLALLLLGCAATESTPTRVSPEGPGVKTIIQDGGRLDWSKNLDLIAFDRKGKDNFYDVWTMRPDGSNQRCVTCDTPDLPKKHVGQPAWHPTGKYIVLQAEKSRHAGRSLKARPGLGVDNDVWVVTADGKQAFRLTNVPQGSAVLHPKFSHRGDKLIWAQRLEGPPPGELLGGKWEMKMADFIIGNTPRLANVRTLDLGRDVFFETHGFSPDDGKIIFTANLGADQAAHAMDIYTLDLATNRVENLTNSDDWDEHAHFSPDGKRIVWMSSRDSGTNPQQMATMTTDLWVMDADGGNKTRLTRFSDPRAVEHAGKTVIVGDPSWSPDGKSVMCRLIVDRGIAQLINLKKEIEPVVRVEVPD